MRLYVSVVLCPSVHTSGDFVVAHATFFFPESIAQGSSVQSLSEKVHRIKYTEDQVHSVNTSIKVQSIECIVHRVKCIVHRVK